MNQKLLILGAGQFGLLTKEIAESMACFEAIDFLDDNSPLAVGRLSDYEALSGKYDSAIVAIGNPDLRLSWIQRLQEAGYQVAILVHPSAHVSPSAKLMKGTIIEANATVQANTTIATGCILSSGSVIRHNASVEEGCHIDCNAVVLSGATVPTKTKVPPLTCFAADIRKRRIDETVGNYRFEDGM